MVHVLLKPGLENFEHYFASVWDECNCAVVWAFFVIVFLWDWDENWPFPVLWPLLSFPNFMAYWVQHFQSIKKMSPHYRGLECRSSKSRNTWSNRQIWPDSTEWSRAKANRVLPRKQTPSSNNTREDSTHGDSQMVNTKIRLIIFFAAKDGEALYSQQKQDWELTVAQIMNSLLPNSDLNWRKY